VAPAHVFVADLQHPALDTADLHHLTRVLRLRAGEPVSCSDGAGGWRPCRFEGRVALSPDGPVARPARPMPLLCVGFAPVKGDRSEWAVQKLTEAGVDRIVLLVTDRSVVRWASERAGRQLERLRAVARQAAAQSRRLWLPDVTPPQPLESVTATSPAAAMAAPEGGPPALDRPCILVGPEGGWSPEEEGLDLARVRLGPGILRTETAAVAAGTLLAALRDGLVMQSVSGGDNNHSW
jgi:16S rRNA (uracil1498-N3)-methyltransferase